MRSNRLTLVGPEDGVDVPSDDATDLTPVLITRDPGPPALRLVQVDEGPLPDDAA
jgi:hypothetical protein